MNRKVSEVVGEKLFDLANLAAGAMIFGQFLSGQGFQWSVMLIGLAVVLGLYIAAGLLVKWSRE